MREREDWTLVIFPNYATLLGEAEKAGPLMREEGVKGPATKKK